MAIALVGSIGVVASGTATFNSANGTVSSVTVVNAGAVALTFKYLQSGVWQTFSIPVGTTTVTSSQYSFPPLVKDAQGNWDWDYTTVGWILEGD